MFLNRRLWPSWASERHSPRFGGAAPSAEFPLGKTPCAVTDAHVVR
jgi:hypothetical protein